MNRILDKNLDIFNLDNDFFRPLEPFFKDFNSFAMMPSMKTDIIKDGENFILEIEVPGFSKEDISIELDDGVLIITAEKKVEEKQETKNYQRKERFLGKYQRHFVVGDNITNEDIKAKLENGILELTIIPRKIEKKSSKINID